MQGRWRRPANRDCCDDCRASGRSAEMCKTLRHVVAETPADTHADPLGADLLREASGSFPSGRRPGPGLLFVAKCAACRTTNRTERQTSASSLVTFLRSVPSFQGVRHRAAWQPSSQAGCRVDPGEEATPDARSVSANGRAGGVKQAEGADGEHFAGRARTSAATARGGAGCSSGGDGHAGHAWRRAEPVWWSKGSSRQGFQRVWARDDGSERARFNGAARQSAACPRVRIERVG